MNVTTTQDRVEPGEPIKLSAEVLDSAYVEVNDGRVVATSRRRPARRASCRSNGSSSTTASITAASFPTKPGLYQVKVTATRGERRSARASIHVRASAGDNEYFDAPMRAPLLKRIAEDTGGRFFTTANAALLPEAISYSGRGVTVVEERELWDMPIVLIALIALMAAEWGYRRARGLA